MSDNFTAFLVLWCVFQLGIVAGYILRDRVPWFKPLYSCELINDVYRINTSGNPYLTDAQIDLLVQECNRQNKKIYAELSPDGFKFIDPKSLMGNE